MHIAGRSWCLFLLSPVSVASLFLVALVVVLLSSACFGFHFSCSLAGKIVLLPQSDGLSTADLVSHYWFLPLQLTGT
jgi:uncharacterized membrane protein